MTDPIYIYKKGVGWITYSAPVVKMYCGTMVMLEFRQPNRKEKYICVRKNGHIHEDSTEEYFRIQASFQEYAYAPTKISSCNDDFYYCTLVPV